MKHAAPAALGLALGLALGSALVGALVGAGACAPGGEEAPAAGEAPADQTYTVRGEVVALPGANDPAPELRIRHETIPDFETYEGEVVGMASMTMPFPLAPEVLSGGLAGLEPGDPVEFVLAVSWEDTPPYRITRVEELPPETTLDFEKAVAVEEPLPGAEADGDGIGSSPP